MLNVIDNSGAAVAECINVLKMNRAAKVGKSKPPTTTTIPPSPSTQRRLRITEMPEKCGGGSYTSSASDLLKRSVPNRYLCSLMPVQREPGGRACCYPSERRRGGWWVGLVMRGVGDHKTAYKP